MPGKVKVKIISGKNLPVMDRSSDTTDAYVEIKLGNTTYKTDVCRRTLHPQWNTDWYRFEVDDSELQDEPLQIRLMDHDTYSANDAIGKVYLNLNPLLLPVAGQLAIGDNNPHHEISGWIPVYDTMHGIRGEVNVTVKVELFSDFNRFRQSSCGVHFFYSPTVPQGYQAKIINGFVEELIVNDDPEYQWIDKIRTPRASNEARQTLFFKLSGELQRKIGVKALGLGGNAVIGYRQCFDLEGESGIVARGIGTAVTLVKAVHSVHHAAAELKEEYIENYLKFVGDGKSFSLCSTSLPHNFNIPFSLLSSVTPDTSVTSRLPKLTTRQCVSLESNIKYPSISNPNLHEGQSNIKVLLSQEDRRGKSAMSRRFQKFKHSQKSLSKKMIALKAKLNDSIGEETDDLSSPAVVDRRKLFKRTSSDSSAMAEILARSVIRATTSLSCILEDQPHSPHENETMGKLEPIANLLSQKESEISSLDELANDAQSCSSSESSSSCSEYEYRDFNRSNNDVETLSNIITNVERLQRCLSREGLHKQYSLPAIPTKGFSLSSLDNFNQFGSFSGLKESKTSLDESILSTTCSASSLSHFDQSRSELKPERRSSDTYDSRAVFEETRLLRKPEKLPRYDEVDLGEGSCEEIPESTLSKFSYEIPMESNDATDNMLQTCSLERSNTLDHSENMPEKNAKFCVVPSEPQGLVQSALQAMHIGRASLVGTESARKSVDSQSCESRNKSFTDSKIVNDEESQPKGIVKTALQTMLIDRADVMGTGHVVNLKEEPQKLYEPTSLRSMSILNHEKNEPKGLVKTALQTMLFERVNLLDSKAELSLETDQVDISNGKGKKSAKNLTEDSPQCSAHNSNNLKLLDKEATSTERFEELTEENLAIAPVTLENINIKPKRMVKTAMQTILLEKFNLLNTYTPPTSPNSLSDKSSSGTAGGNFSFKELDPRRRTIPKSSSSASFGEYQSEREKETVLGMPFTSLSSLLSIHENDIRQKRAAFFSDSHLNQPVTENLKEKEGVRKKRFKFLTSKTGEQKRSGMFQKFRRGSKKSPLDDVHKDTAKDQHQNILSRMFHQRHEEKSIKDVETQTSNEMLNCPKSPESTQNIFPSNNMPKTKISIDPPKPPSHTDSASGDFLAHSKTKSACLTSHHSSPAQERQDQNGGERKDEPSPESAGKVSQSPVKVNYMVPLHRRSSDSDLSITPKGNSLTGSDKSMGNAAAYFMRSNYIRRGQMNQDHFDMLEYPFLTMTKFPPRFIIQIGGSISARSVKLLERILNVDEPESRDIWWSEIRMEIRSHARSLNCNAVLGYTELTSICDDVCVLSACGTAAVIDFNSSAGDEDNFSNVQLIHKSMDRDKHLNGHHRSSHESPDHRIHSLPSCYVTHLPYDEKGVPLKAKVSKCPMCLKGRVPEVLIATIEPPESVPSIGKGCFIESHVSRSLKDIRGETIAKEISDGLPFLEYELHRILVNKLKIKGMNAIFSLKVRISVGEKMLVGVATGTAVYLSSLPTPDLPVLVTDKVSDEKLVADLQEMLNQTVQRNREIYQIKNDNLNQKCLSDEESDEEQASLDISCGNKDCCILEMDDPEDAEVLKLLMQEKVPDGFYVVSTESVPGLEDMEIVKNLQMFTQIYRAKLAPPYNLQKHFVRLLQSVYFKLRRMVPCALCDLQFRIDVPESDEIQLCVIGMALGLGKKGKKSKPAIAQKKPEDDLIFKLDDDHPQDSNPTQISKSNPSSLKYRSHRSPSKYRPQSLKQRHIPHNERHGVDITPLSYVPGGNIDQYLGNFNFFFIRETTSIREEGGLSGFIHSFITEVLAIVRSHVTALGGNALVAFFMTECVLNHNLHKNQGQCLINVGGDVVSVSYFRDEA